MSEGMKGEHCLLPEIDDVLAVAVMPGEGE